MIKELISIIIILTIIGVLGNWMSNEIIKAYKAWYFPKIAYNNFENLKEVKMDKRKSKIIRERMQDMAHGYIAYSLSQREKLIVDATAYNFVDIACEGEAEEVREFWKEYYEECKKL